MRAILPLAAAVLFAPLAGCTTYAGAGAYDRDYHALYRPGSYEAYPLSNDARIYRGTDGRYYCDRRDGTVGLVVGAGVGALLGNLIAPRGSNTIGTLIGAAGGAAIGYAIERGEVRCE